MKKFLSTIFLFFSFVAFGQDFLTNPDYVYGMGIADNIEDADEAAFLSLAKTINVNVVSTSTYNAFEDKNGYDENVNKHISVTSSFSAKDAKIFIKKIGDDIYVYRYINHKEYVDTHMEEYNRYMKQVNGFSGSHDCNKSLGSCYRAYQCLDDEIMDAYNKGNKTLKENTMNRAKKIYNLMPSHYFSGAKMRSSAEFLSGVMYFKNNSWHTPTIFHSDYKDINSTIYGKDYEYAFVNVYEPTLYRFTYEEDTDNGVAVINVEEKWYFNTFRAIYYN